MTLVSLNGRILPAAEARVSPFDRGLLYGDGAFETLRAEGGVPLLFEERLRRLDDALEFLQIQRRLGTDALRSQTRELLGHLGHTSARVRITVTRGEGLDRGAPVPFGACQEPMTLITAWPLLPGPFPGKTRCCVVTDIRRDERSPLSARKTLNYLPSLVARELARRRGCGEALLTDGRGFLSEASMSNLFWLREDRLFRPAGTCGALPGVTAGVLIEAAAGACLELREVEATPGEIQASDLLFLTNAIGGVTRVTQVDAMRLSPAPSQEEIFRTLTGHFLRLYPMAHRSGAENGLDGAREGL